MNKYEVYIHGKIFATRKGMKIDEIRAGKMSTATRKAIELFLEKYPEFENRHIYIWVNHIGKV